MGARFQWDTNIKKKEAETVSPFSYAMSSVTWYCINLKWGSNAQIVIIYEQLKEKKIQQSDKTW